MFKIAAVIALALSVSACAPNFSEGEITGVVTKLSKKGIIFKSWEGTLNQGGTKTVHDSEGRSDVVPNATYFNVSDPTVIDQLREAAASGDRVTLSYNQWLLAPLTISNDRVVNKLEKSQ